MYSGLALDVALVEVGTTGKMLAQGLLGPILNYFICFVANALYFFSRVHGFSFKVAIVTVGTMYLCIGKVIAGYLKSGYNMVDSCAKGDACKKFVKNKPL